MLERRWDEENGTLEPALAKDARITFDRNNYALTPRAAAPDPHDEQRPRLSPHP